MSNLEDLPSEVLRAAWIAGTQMRRSLTPKNDPARHAWKDVNDLWDSERVENLKVMRAAMAAIDRAIGGKA